MPDLLERARAEVGKVDSVLTEMAGEIERLRAALEAIAGGHIDRFPGAPDVMQETPEEFRHKMWGWCQKVAAAAIAKAEGV